MGESYFDGGLLQLIGWALLGSLITVCTLGICFPWALCMIYNWEISHTVINGHRLRFTGKATNLFLQFPALHYHLGNLQLLARYCHQKMEGSPHRVCGLITSIFLRKKNYGSHDFHSSFHI